ncbi:argininosuccinate lyase [[Clostridium] aminophilum]|uniref:argininosuccinate lyase n=1 Tax=[Clostridium] aminophilum TaxID=1526 RepID=UPI0026EB1D99|nr:argininosuccinate lyase [[Clostridium] aminophilum]MDD6196466.1 argininosuccinate lyase [[Clostridium] aminophilum]
MAKMWAGRFSKTTDKTVDDFNSSLPFDNRLYREDITGSTAHAKMLGKQGIIPQDEADCIVKELGVILKEIEEGKIAFSDDAEDIHMFVEQILTERIGDAGKRLHTSRSRNDQVALDMRLYVKKEIRNIHALILDMMQALNKSAAEHTETVMPGYTHLQRAQPVTFGHYMMAYANMLKRDVKRLENTYELMDEMPLGSGALAGTTYPIDRDYVREQLGFAAVTENSLDGVSDRDYCIELCSDLSILMMHLSRLSEEIILWCSWEFKFIELDDAFSTGSSIMPQKKNPDVCELIRGKTGRVYGALMTCLTFLKGLPLAYNKDMQEDKEAVFDAIDTVKMCLKVLKPMFETMTVLPENMKRAASRGFINATDCADYLTKKGVPFRDAYHITGQLVGECVKKEKGLGDLTLEEFKAHSEIFGEDVYHAIDLSTCVKERKSFGGPAPEEVERQIGVIGRFIEAHRAFES